MKRGNISIFAPSFMMTAVMAISPALSKIAAEFPSRSATEIQLLMTLPYLVSIPVILMTGNAVCRFTKRNLLIAAMVLLGTGSGLSFLFHTRLEWLWVFSALIGIAIGILSPVSTAFIAESTDPAKRSFYLGIQSSIIGIGSVFFTYAGGWLANYHWYYTYLCHLTVIPILWMLKTLPKGNTEPARERKIIPMNTHLAVYLLFGAFAIICIYAFSTNLAMYLAEAGIEDSKYSGSVLAVYSVACIIAGVTSGKLTDYAGKHAYTVVLGVGALGFLWMGNGPLGIPLGIGAWLVGLSFAWRMPVGYVEATSVVLPAYTSFAISLYACANSLGQFLSPVIINTVTPQVTMMKRYGIIGGIMAGMAVLYEIAEGYFRRRQRKE